MAVPGIASLSLDGTLVSPTEPERLSGNLRLKGLFDDLGFVTVLLPDTSLRNRVSIPKDIRLSGTLKADTGTLYPAVELAVDSGLLAVKGMLPKNVIGRTALTRLHLYKGEEHKHAAQKPEAWTLD